MFGRIAAVAIVVALAVGVWLLWPDDDPAPPTSTTSTTSTTTTVPSTSTTTPADTTSTAPPEAGTIDTVEEAEEVLRQLWFGWFEGIYNQDEDRIKEVVASQKLLDDARKAFGAPFTDEPTANAISFVSVEILRSDEDCLAVFNAIDVTQFRGPGAVTDSVEILRQTPEGWKFSASWADRNDLWEQDCEAQLEPLP
jgi:hypothetical protein